MDTPVHIRPATPDDAPALAYLNAIFNESSDPPEQIATRLRDPRRVETPILAEIDGQVAGFAALRVVPCVFYAAPHAELTELYVEPAYRKRGVARALVAYAEKLALEAGADALMLLTGHDNHAAQRLYRTLGYDDLDQALIKPLPADNSD